MKFNEQYPASFDNYPRPSRMKKPDVSRIDTSAATRFIGYIGDQLKSILIDKYGKTRGEKTFQGLLDTGNNAIYTVCTDIIKEKIKMFQDLGILAPEYINKDYFDTNYFALWSKWMDEYVKKPYSHLIKKEAQVNKLKEALEKISGKKVKLVESNTKKDFNRAKKLVISTIKYYFPDLTPDEKQELWDAVIEDYSESDISEITTQDIIEIAESSGIGYAGDDDE